MPDCRQGRSPIRAWPRCAPPSNPPRPITSISSPGRMGQVGTSFRKTLRLIDRLRPGTDVALRGKSKKQRLEEFLRDKQPTAIDEQRWRDLLALLAPISENYLRELLHATGLPIAQPFGGVRLGSFEDLEASLLDMEAEYAKA